VAFGLATGYLYGAINVIADWTFVLIPITVLLDSELDRRSKISVSIVMALGAVGSVSSIMRMVYLKGLIHVPTGLSCTYHTPPLLPQLANDGIQLLLSKRPFGRRQNQARASSPRRLLSCAL